MSILFGNLAMWFRIVRDIARTNMEDTALTAQEIWERFYSQGRISEAKSFADESLLSKPDENEQKALHAVLT